MILSAPASFKQNTKNILFISWDSSNSNYMENLFFPIFAKIQDSTSYRIIILQFSWASPTEITRLQKLASVRSLHYYHQPVMRKGPLGLAFSLWRGIQRIKTIVHEDSIQIIIPRSTNPAIMVNRLGRYLRHRGMKILFDADGLPIQERIDFLGRNPNGLVMKWLRKHEIRCLAAADQVLTRSKKSIDIHLQAAPDLKREKFAVVSNGRDPVYFQIDHKKRLAIRAEFGLAMDDVLWVYTGALGPAHELKNMVNLFLAYKELRPSSLFLLLTRDIDFIRLELGGALPNGVRLMETPFENIPGYLSAADLGISLRKPAKSLAGLAPIKVGEYLMMGLPIISSACIGDTEEALAGKPFAFLYEKGITEMNVLAKWVDDATKMDKTRTRNFGIDHFGIQKSVNEYLSALERIASA
jgi:glycosyltransferase involved in cell wall biosynthesis